MVTCEFVETCYRAEFCDTDPESCTSRLVCLGEMDLSYLYHKREESHEPNDLLEILTQKPWDSRHGTKVGVNAGCMCWRCRATRSRMRQLERMLDEEGS